MSAERDKVIYSAGTGARPLAEFIALLRGCGVAVAADVRSFPSSRRYPHFSREELRRSLAREGIEYVWLGECLGGFREGGYESHMLTEGFQRGLEELEELARRSPTVFFCAERHPRRCHRRFISRALEERGWKVLHLGAEDDARAHPGQGALTLDG